MRTHRTPRRLIAPAIAVAVVAAAAIGTVSNTAPIQAMPAGIASSVITVEPARILDTRSGTGLPGPITANESNKLTVSGDIPTRVDGADVSQTIVPDGATGVLLNVTALRPTGQGFISIRPGTASGEPSASNLNASPGQVVPNAVTVALPTTGAAAGTIDIWYGAATDTETTGILVDVVGYTEEAGAGGTPGPAGPAGPAGPEGPAGADGDDLYDRTIIVKGSGTTTENGSAFLAALATASAANPTSTNRWLVWLEPGVFDLGTGQAIVDDWVSVRGSGRGATTVVADRRSGSTNAAGALEFSTGSEISNLRVENTATTGTGNFGVGIYVNSGDRLEIRDVHVDVDTTGGAPNPRGINGGADAEFLIEDSVIEAVSTGFVDAVAPSSAVGSSSAIDIRRSTLTSSSTALNASRAAVTVEHSHLEAPIVATLSSIAGSLQISHTVMIGTTTGTGAPTCLAITTGNAFLSNSCP